MAEQFKTPEELLAELAELKSQLATCQQTNDFLSGILEGTQDFIAALDSEYRFIALNSAYQKEFEHVFGQSIELGMSLLDAIAAWPETQARAIELWEQAFRGEEFTIVQELNTNTSKKHYYEITYSPIKNKQQQIIGASQRTRNISDRKQTEAALQKTRDELELRVAERTAELISVNHQLQDELDERTHIEAALRVSQARFAGILEIASDAIISVNANQIITLYNQGAETIFGYTAQEVIGQPLDILLPGRFAAAHRQHVTDFKETSQRARKMGERREIYGRRKDGREFPAEASISKLQLEEETVFTVILRDISERKQSEQALERLSRQNELILNSVGEGLCGLNATGNITFVNPAAARLLGYQVNDLLGQSIQLILPHSNMDGSPYPLETSPIYAALQDGSVYQATDEMFQRRDGTCFPAEYISTPIWEQEQIIGAVITFRDITDRRVVERMKDEFISVVSHELRTPLTSIHGSLGLLASGLLSADSERGQRLLKIAVDSTDRLVRLINDILDIERIESGKVTMAKAVCNIAELVDEAVRGVQAIAEQANITLSVSVIPAQIWADPDRIIQILTNLLSNAIKFSPHGSTIWVTVSQQESNAEPLAEPSRDTSSHPVVLIAVKDQGRGIPSDKLETIFERFQQVDASDSRNSDGTGLGLAICRSIVQQHAGQIWVESVLGQGSTFYFTLPLFQAKTPAVESGAERPLVLICDDDETFCHYLCTLLKQQNYRAVAVPSGEDVVREAIAQQPNVILLDLLMPGMNGWQAIALLKQQQETQDIPIIVCSVSSPSQSNYPSKGFVNWLSKPIDEVSLVQSLHQALLIQQSTTRNISPS
jgi:PAS domain S-box-containing protein